MQKGCACKFLYGPDTDEAGKEDIADSLFDKTELKLEIQLYKKGGMSGISQVFDVFELTSGHF